MDANILLVGLFFLSLNHVLANELVCPSKACTLNITNTSQPICETSNAKVTSLIVVSKVLDKIPSHLLKCFPNLQMLEAKNMRQLLVLEPFAVDDNNRLKVMKMSNNSISNWDSENMIFEQLKHVTYLDLSHNRIDIVDCRMFYGLLVLGTLDLSHNRIKAFVCDFLFVPSLRTLRLNNNGLSSLSMQPEHAKLTNLFLENNQLTKLNFLTDGNPNSYVLSNHCLSSTTFANCLSKISAVQKFLICINDNPLCRKTIQLKVFKHLRVINLSNNDLAQIEIGFYGANLQCLILENSKIKILKPCFFNSSPNLKYLSISNNDISDFDLSNVQLKELRALKLANNRIKQLAEPSKWSNTPLLKEIDFSGNNFDTEWKVDFKQKLHKERIKYENVGGLQYCAVDKTDETIEDDPIDTILIVIVIVATVVIGILCLMVAIIAGILIKKRNTGHIYEAPPIKSPHPKMKPVQCTAVPRRPNMDETRNQQPKSMNNYNANVTRATSFSASDQEDIYGTTAVLPTNKNTNVTKNKPCKKQKSPNKSENDEIYGVS